MTYWIASRWATWRNTGGFELTRSPAARRPATTDRPRPWNHAPSRSSRRAAQRRWPPGNRPGTTPASPPLLRRGWRGGPASAGRGRQRREARQGASHMAGGWYGAQYGDPKSETELG